MIQEFLLNTPDNFINCNKMGKILKLNNKVKSFILVNRKTKFYKTCIEKILLVIKKSGTILI